MYRGPELPPDDGVPQAAAQAAAQGTEAHQAKAQHSRQAASQNPVSPERPHYPLVGGFKPLFPERLPKVWTSQDWETEQQAAAAWDRPMRSNLHDTPFYPWVPNFRVSFKLGYKP